MPELFPLQLLLASFAGWANRHQAQVIGNCELLLSMDLSHVFVTSPKGEFATTFTVPNAVSTFGVRLYGQAWAPEENANAWDCDDRWREISRRPLGSCGVNYS